MDHLGIRDFMVLGFCIGGPFIWNLLKRAGDRVIAAVPAQPSGYRPEMPDLSYNNNMKGWGPELCARRPDITMAMVDTFLTNMYRARADFVYTVTRDFVRNCQTPILVLPDDVPGAPVCRRDGNRASRAERAGEPLSVEGHHGQDPAGGAPHPHVPAGASACGGSAIHGRRRPVAPDPIKSIWHGIAIRKSSRTRECSPCELTSSASIPLVGIRLKPAAQP